MIQGGPREIIRPCRWERIEGGPHSGSPVDTVLRVAEAGDIQDAGDTQGSLRSEATNDALDLLGDIAEWELSASRWEQIDPLLDRLEVAIGADDPTALDGTVAELELLGPTRVTRIGTTPTVPAPPSVRTRTERLVHALRPTEQGAAGQRDGGADGRSTARRS